ncbi:MAG: hypothetical protein GYB36_02770 [Alphaproteobacteria bacterium]|nr:hypothetical protein [Alphaproteobacteria bacterium]
MSATTVDFAPLIPLALLYGLLATGLLILVFGAIQRLSGWLWRGLTLAGIGLVLANPSLVEEERELLPDIALVVTDTSESMQIGERNQAAGSMVDALRAYAENDNQLELVEVETRTAADGTALFDTVSAALAGIPQDRLAGLILNTDGQIHDAPGDAEALNLDAPIHQVMPGDRRAGDRRLIIEEAPRYGIVGQGASFRLLVEDSAVDGTAMVTFRFEGGAPQSHRIAIGRSIRIDVPVERRGQNVIEIEVEPGPQELSLVNNRAAVSVNGVRDRLRVLLVTGEPHNGARAWRDLLKSDPSVDLVHFTILRPPDRRDSTPVDELALIPFPVQELFVERLSEFDLVIFDRYRRRNIMPLLYFDHIARYVDEGGALLVTAGPPFAGGPSLFRTPLASVLPVRPTGGVDEGGFTPRQTDTGLRHPVTTGLEGGGDEPSWGRWMRNIPGQPLGGQVLLETPDGDPLLVLQHQDRGRAAIVMSDQTWLWSRGFEGGGPYAEMFRRVAHWLMREPELDEERLTAIALDQELQIERVTLADQAPPLEITWPDGRVETAVMTEGEAGRFESRVSAEGTGLVRLRSGDLTTVAALGPLNPLEYADLRPTFEVLDPFIDATRGGQFGIGEGSGLDLPGIRRTRATSDQAGRSWLGLQRNERYIVRATTRTSLLPGFILMLILIGLTGLGWWREGR